MTPEMLARIAYEAARGAHYTGSDMLEWAKADPGERHGSIMVAKAVLSGKVSKEELNEIFPDGDCVAQRVLLGVFSAALPIQPEPEEPETEDERKERLALEKRSRIVSPCVTEREAPGGCVVIA